MTKKSNSSENDSSITIFGVTIGGWKFKVVGAISVAALALVSGAAGQEIQRWRSSSAEQAKAAIEAAKAYDQLGDVPRRAAEYIATQKEGSKDDVRVVARLLRSMMFEIENERYSPAHFQQSIGGRAGFWSKAFAALASKKSRAASEFSSGELAMFRALSDDLASLLHLYGRDFESDSVETVAAAQDGRILAEYR